MGFTDYVRILRKNVLVIALAIVLGLAAAAAWALTRTPQYEATSQVFVSTQAGTSIAELQQGSSFTQARVATYVSLASSPIVLAPVIDEYDLDTTPALLAERVHATSPQNTTIISVTVSDTDPDRSAEVANAVAESLTLAVADLETLPGAETSPVKLTRIKDAQPAAEPATPDVPLALAVGALLGLALGLAAAALRTVLDTRIRTQRDVEAVTDRPVIGSIPFDPTAPAHPVIVRTDPHSARSEAIRTLRTNLQFVEVEGGHTFVVTSSLPSEGKTTTAINLALAIAATGSRVVLLDGDLRKPKVADYLGVEGAAGLTDVLIGRAALEDVLLDWADLRVVPAGRIPPNPSELLGSDRMRSVLATLAASADVVICDSPPLLPVTDAALLATRTSGAIVVVAAGRTTRPQLGHAMDALASVGARIAGIAMTMVPTRGPDAYSYSSGYGYRSEQAPATPVDRTPGPRRSARATR